MEAQVSAVTIQESRVGAGTLWLAAMMSAMVIMTGCTSSPPAMPHSQQVTLTGSNEVPPVTTTAAGSGTVAVNPDGTMMVVIAVAGMTPTAAHIHEGASGANGPVIVPLVKSGDNTFSAPPGAKLTESQYAAYKAGNLYINVHSAKNSGGEIRAQLKGN